MGLGKLFTFKSKMSDEVTVSVGKTLGWSDLLSFSKDKALENSAFWICLMNLARTFGSLPIHAYSKNNDGSRKIDTTSPEAILIRLLCPYMNPYAFRFCMSINFELYGVAYAKIVRSSLGKPIALHTDRLHPGGADGDRREAQLPIHSPVGNASPRPTCW
jgi:phage portal protein BeeE